MAEQKCRECGHGNAMAALFCDRCGRALHAQERDPLVGKTIAERYHLLECIGAGGAGVLYRAEHVTLRRRIALKLLHKHLATSDDAVERFRREAITVCEIDNEHIPQVFDFGRSDDGRLFFAMEFLEGETLAQAIAKAPQGQFAVERVVDILAQIADGLVDAHTLGYVHRDLRPRSIFLTKRRSRADFVKLLDFGLAKLVQPEVDAQRTAMGMTYGDPRYMAPEQARGEAVDRRADIYSLGAIGFELLTGEPPYSGSGTFEILGKVLDAPVPRVRDRRSDCPPWLESVVRMALHKSPADRFQTVTQLLDALERKQVLSGAPAQPGAARVAVPAAATPITAAKPPQATLAMPTVAPPAGMTAGGRSTMSYPAVKPVRPATFGVNNSVSPAKPAAATASSSADELRLLAERVPPAAATSSSQKPVATSPAVKPSPAKPAAAPVASKPAVAPTLEKPIAKIAAPAKAVVIKPTLPSRSDPTPRTTAARIEQEAAGWLETAQSLFDEGTNPEAGRQVQESADAAEAASKLLASSAGSPSSLDTGEDIGADPGENDTILSLSAPTPPPAVQKAAAVKPAPSPVAAAAIAKPTPAAAVSKPAVKPVAAASPAPAPSAVSPVASRSAEISKPVVARPDRSQPVAAIAPSRPQLAAEPRAVATPEVTPAPTTTPTPAATPVAVQPAPARETAPVPSPAPSLGAAVVAAPAVSAAPVVPVSVEDDDIPDADATLPHIKTGAETDSAQSPSPSDDDTQRHDKLAAPLPTTAPLPKIEDAAAEHESTKTPESGPPVAMNNAETAWFAKSESPDGFADDETYSVARRKTPLWIYAGAAGVVLIAGIAWLSGGSKPKDSPATGSPPAVTSTAGSGSTAATANSAGTSGAGSEPSPAPSAGPAPTPVVVESLTPPAGSAAKPAGAETATPKPDKPASDTATAAASPPPAVDKKAEPTDKKPEPGDKSADKPGAGASKPGTAAADAGKSKPEAPAADKPAAKAAASAKASEPAADKPGPKLAMASPSKAKGASEPAEPSEPAAKPAAKGKAEEVTALIKLGKRRLDDGDTDAAAGIFARAVELDGGNAEALAGLGSAQYEQGEYDQAARQLQKAARLLPRKASLHEMLADAQFKAKRYKESAETARKLLKQDPGSAKAKQILERAEKQLAGSP